MADMTLKARITEDMKNAMREKNQQRLNAIRMILAAVKQIEVDERIEIDDQRMLIILDKLLKQRRESIQQYSEAKRQDLVDKETFEADLIQGYLPAQLSDSEIRDFVQKAIAKSGASSIRDMAKVMAELKPELQGRADMGLVSQLVKEKLS